MNLLEYTQKDIHQSNSRLSFTFTGSGSFEIWDKYLSYDNQPLFHLGNICGTCAFFFNQINDGIKNSYTVDEIRDLLNKGVSSLNERLINSLSQLMPVGTYEVSLFRIHPYQTCKNGKGDYFKEEQNPRWYPELDEPPSDAVGMTYYRGTTQEIDKYTTFYEFFVPLYQPEFLDEQRIQFYQKQIAEGEQPTVIALGAFEGRTAIQSFSEDDDDYSHLYLVHYLLDGHHKIQAAVRENKPITLVSFVLKDKCFENITKLIHLHDN